MNRRNLRPACLPFALFLCLQCTPSSDGGGNGNPAANQPDPASGPSGNHGGGNAGSGDGQVVPPGSQVAHIQTRVTVPGVTASGALKPLSFSGGGATRPGLQSLKYMIRQIEVCESLETHGSGYSNASGCLDLYHGDESRFMYRPDQDYTALGDEARATDTGFIDLLDDSSRGALGATTTLTPEHVRSYNYGIITWAPPIKVKATIALPTGGALYTHDGRSTSELIGTDHYRDYFTLAGLPLDMPPAEQAVVLSNNGGNWFKFQAPLSITTADIDDRRAWVLDLVFDPDGIVKGYDGDRVSGHLREHDDGGATHRAITVPMLDLAPIPHRESEQSVRESYLAHVTTAESGFDVRLELYSIEGDASGTVYGVDVKTLISGATREMPPEFSKISYLESAPDGTLQFLSWNRTPILTGFRRASPGLESTTADMVCTTFDDRAGSEGGSAIVLSRCPSHDVAITFELVGRTRVTDGTDLNPPDAAH